MFARSKFLLGTALLWQVVVTPGGSGGITGTLTATRVPFASSASALTDDADMTFSTDTLTVTHANVKAGSGSGALSVGGILCKAAPAAATAGTSEEVLATCTIPANSLPSNGDVLMYRMMFHTAANANNKQVRVRIGGIGGALVCDTGTNAANNQLITGAEFYVQRLSATTAAGFCDMSRNASGTASPANVTSWYQTITASVTWANSNDFVITGTTPTASGDLTLDSYYVAVY